MKRRKSSLNNLFCSLFLIALSTYFYSKYVVENECLAEGKRLRTSVVDKYFTGTKGTAWFLRVKVGNCVESIEVTSKIYDRSKIGDIVFFTGILEDCNFCYSVENREKENKIGSYIVYFFALVLLIDIYGKFLPESWIGEK